MLVGVGVGVLVGVGVGVLVGVGVPVGVGVGVLVGVGVGVPVGIPVAVGVTVSGRGGSGLVGVAVGGLGGFSVGGTGVGGGVSVGSTGVGSGVRVGSAVGRGVEVGSGVPVGTRVGGSGVAVALAADVGTSTTLIGVAVPCGTGTKTIGETTTPFPTGVRRWLGSHAGGVNTSCRSGSTRACDRRKFLSGFKSDSMLAGTCHEPAGVIANWAVAKRHAKTANSKSKSASRSRRVRFLSRSVCESCVISLTCRVAAGRLVSALDVRQRRKNDAERAADPFFALDVNFSLVRLDNGFGHIQPQA